MESYPREHPEWFRETLARLFDMALEGRLNPRVAFEVPLRDASRACAPLERADVAEKVLLAAGNIGPRAVRTS